MDEFKLSTREIIREEVSKRNPYEHSLMIKISSKIGQGLSFEQIAAQMLHEDVELNISQIANIYSSLVGSSKHRSLEDAHAALIERIERNNE